MPTVVSPLTGPVLGTRLSITGLSEYENNNDESVKWIPFVDMDKCTTLCDWLGARHIIDVFVTNLAGTITSPNPQDSMLFSTKFEPKTVNIAPPKAGLDDGATRIRTGIGWHKNSGPSVKYTPLLLTRTCVLPILSAGV